MGVVRTLLLNTLDRAYVLCFVLVLGRVCMRDYGSSARHGSLSALALSPCPPSPRCSDPEKLACCEQCLRLLAAQLWAPGAAGRSAVYATDAQQGLAVLLRALLTGCELVEASAADDSWQVRGWGCSLCPPARM